jgi:HSP20 family protein
VQRRTAPFDFMRSMTEDLERFLGGFTFTPRTPFPWLGAPRDEFWPAMEVEEVDGSLHVRADLPGLTKSDISVEITDGTLAIQGERKHEERRKEGSYYRSERAYGTFLRTIPLPEGANADTARASFKDGVLEITIDVPKTRTPEKRAITIA